MPAAANQASAGIVDRSVVAVMHVMMCVVRQVMMMVVVMMMMMDGGGSRTGQQRRHTDNNGQGRENLTHQRLQNEHLQ
jgi:lipopolysaccharide/colanic/teichoic acid biosynthesis glycosyltransferase